MEVALVNGLFARLAGPSDGPILLFVHAFADSSLAFTPLFETSLARRFRIVAVDLPGFGGTPRRNGIETLADHACVIAGVARSFGAMRPFGLVAHSVASMIAVDVARKMERSFAGLFSIEGNLTSADAYFSGRAADFDDPHEFKRQFLEEIWQLSQSKPVFRRYFAAAVTADPVAMWNLGRDARRLSTGDAPGRAYRAVQKSLYYWSTENTTETSRRWIEKSSLAHRQFTDASHWPMVDQPAATAQAITTFYAGL